MVSTRMDVPSKTAHKKLVPEKCPSAAGVSERGHAGIATLIIVKGEHCALRQSPHATLGDRLGRLSKSCNAGVADLMTTKCLALRHRPNSQ